MFFELCIFACIAFEHKTLFDSLLTLSKTVTMERHLFFSELMNTELIFHTTLTHRTNTPNVFKIDRFFEIFLLTLFEKNAHKFFVNDKKFFSTSKHVSLNVCNDANWGI